MSLLNQAKFACLFMVGAMTFANEALAECKVGDFKSDSAGQLSDIQQLAYLSVMTREQYERAKAGGSASGRYGVISGSASYEQFKETIDKQIDILSITNFQSYQKSWAESALDDNGLEAYRACLRKDGGFHVTVADLGSNLNKLGVDWWAGPYGSLPTPRVVAAKNIANAAQINSLLSSTAWGTQERHFEVPARKSSPNAAADLTILAGGTAKLFYLPPLQVPTGCRRQAERIEWSGTSVIEEAPPAGTLGCSIDIVVEAKAFSRRTGQIWIDIKLDTASAGQKQYCASGRSTQNYNMDLNHSCRFKIPYDTKRIIVNAGNQDADARGVKVVVSY